MKILIDIGHPAHVHYFKNFIQIMGRKGHKIQVIAKDRNVTYKLLEHYNIKFLKRKDYPKNLLGKLLQIPLTDLFVVWQSIKFKPDILMGFSGTHVSHAGFILRKPSIVIDDTEHAKLAHASYKFFTNIILTPECFSKNMGKKQIRFNGYMELCYLHPKYFTPDPSILNLLGVNKNEKYVIMRFVSWHASHDIRHYGFSLAMKRRAVEKMSKYAKVFISSEIDLPEDLKQYQIQIPPERMHDVLAFASLLYGESSTMASECAMLGTPSIFHDNDGRGYTNEEEKKYGLVFNYSESLEDQKTSILKGIALLKKQNLKQNWQKRKEKMLADKIDVTAFMIWFIENFPQSAKKMEEDPNYQWELK